MSRRVKGLSRRVKGIAAFPGSKTELIKPWSAEKRAYIQGKIDDAAVAAAKKLKAKCCVIVAFFDDGAYIHMQDGGQSPMPTDQLYRHLVAAKEAGDDTAVN